MSAFYKARVKLTLWYIFISLCMLAIFTIAAINAEKRAFSRIENVLANRTQRPHLTALLEDRISNFESDFTHRLLVFDIFLVGFSACTSWFLSGKTLKPIQVMVEKQQTFAADVSHELRTPLTTVAMEIEAVKRTNKNIPKVYVDTLDSISEEIKRMSTLTDDLLLAVRSKQSSTRRMKVNISPIIETICKKLSVIAADKQLSLTSHIEPNIYIKGDEEAIKRLCTIFISNAMQYSNAGGTIIVEVKKAKQKAVLIFQDTGIGIAEDEIPHIFDRFYRGKETSSYYKGTGLGLSIAKQILDTYDGDVDIKSQKGKGTTFTLRFPLVS